MVYKVTTAPTALSVSLANAKAQLNIAPAFTDDDVLLTSMIHAATLFIEKIIQGPVMTQSWELQLDDFKDVIKISKCPVSAIASVKYYNSSNADVTVSASDYQTDIASSPARVIFNTTFSIPTVYERFDAVRVAFTAGYANEAAVPADLGAWIKILITQFYNARDYSTVKPETDELIRKSLMSYAAWL